MIQIDHLIKEFDPGSGIRAIDDISFNVSQGEVFGFLGPNGAGKTTTIKILTTLLQPTMGEVTVAGYNVTDDPLGVRMSFGYIGQQSGVDPALTVSENMMLQGRLYHLPKKKIEERIETLLQLFDMQGRGGQWVGSLSGGLKRRLDIVTALIHEPKLLILDEPTTGLDPKSRSDLWAYLRRLNKEEGMTLFLTTHHLEEVDQLADRVGILDSGRIRVIGTPDELKDSLGHDAIHLKLTVAIDNKMLSTFREKEWFKEVIQHGEEIRLYLEKGQEYLSKVIQWLTELGLSAKSVLLARPTFDDVYLKYTGKNWLLAGETAEDEWGNNKWAQKWKKKGDTSESESGSDWEGGGGNGEDWKKWAGQEDSTGSDEQKSKAVQTEDASANSIQSPDNEDQPWKKWGDQANTEWAASDEKGSDQKWPESDETSKADGQKDKPSGKN